jgi:LmbE family N-acetylglucosaminyl deacetylase
MEKILVVAPHPDDETLGAGGYILKQKKAGNEVYILNMTNMKKEYGYKEERITKRNTEIEKMVERFNLDGFYNLNLCPTGLDSYLEVEVIKKIAEVINKIKPTTMILPYQHDVHSDHRITFNLCYSCTKSFRFPFIKKIMMMEILSETEFSVKLFKPNYFVDITEFLDEKIEIVSIFKSEMSQHPFPRSVGTIRANAMVRGSMAGVEYAEAFILLKYIE